jgi:hypothetical protein
MFRRTQYVAFVSAILSIAVALLLAGCPQPQPTPSGPSGEQPQAGQPEEQAPEYQPAEEYEFLVDLESTVGKMMEADARSMGGDEEDIEDMRQDLEDVFSQEEITAEASDTMVRAHGEYSLDAGKLAEEIGENFPSELITGLGTAPVEFPAHFPADRRVAYLFVANPKLLGEVIVDLSMQFMDEVSGAFTGGKDDEESDNGVRLSELMLHMLDVEEPEELTDWLGDEMVLLLITNPDFDPDRFADIEELDFEQVIENFPVYPIIALGAEDSSRGLTVLENTVNFFFASGGVRTEMERTEIDGVEAIMLPVEDMANDMFYSDEDDKNEFITVMEQIGPSIAVALPGYVLIGAEPALLSAMDAFEPEASGDEGDATVQLAWNWDAMIEFYEVFDPMESIDWEGASEAEREIFSNLDDAIRSVHNAGMGSAELDMGENGDFTVDVVTSVESMGLINSISNIFEYGLGMEAAGNVGNTAGKPSEEPESMAMDEEEGPVEDNSGSEADDASGESGKPGSE